MVIFLSLSEIIVESIHQRKQVTFLNFRKESLHHSEEEKSN